MTLKATVNQSAVISAENNFTDECSIRGDFTISVTSPGLTVVTLQRSFDEGSTWLDVESFTEQTETNARELIAGMLYRLGVKTGDFNTTSVTVRLAK